MIIVALIILVLAVCAVAYGGITKTAGALIGGVLGVVIALVVGVFSMSYTQDPGEAKVIKSFTGEVQPEADTSEGWGWHAPFDNLIDYDIRNRLAAFSNSNNTRVKPEDLLGGELDFSDKDRVSGKMDIFVTYSITPNKVVEIYREYGTQQEFEAKVISPQVNPPSSQCPVDSPLPK